MKKIALISVSDKSGILEFAQQLIDLDYQILSTGGTYKLLHQNGLPVLAVSDYTKFPEILDGRVKTLHPAIHSGLLAVRDSESHTEEMLKHNFLHIDLVAINLYPFAETLDNPESSHHDIIENIDIGGPSMLRSAAKNYNSVTVLCDPFDYPKVIQELQDNQNTTLETRQYLAAKVFDTTYHYDFLISQYFRQLAGLPEQMQLAYEKVRTLRYGENPHQKAAFFRNPDNHDSNITNAKVLAGKELSFNNIVDANSAIELVKEFARPTVVFVKHNNPCGVASSNSLAKAFQLSHQVDSLSAFGAVVALNGPCTSEIVDYIEAQKLFLEIIVCTHFEADALERLKQKPNLRLLELGELKLDTERRDIQKVAGGILIQSADTALLKPENLEIKTVTTPTENQIQSMIFAGKIVKHVKSNAIVLAKTTPDGDEVVTGIGAGQMSRVDAVFLAGHKAKENAHGSVLASDAFFPFEDGIEEAYKVGVTAILQPGGSVRDSEVINTANQLKLAMVFTGLRSFRH